MSEHNSFSFNQEEVLLVSQVLIRTCQFYFIDFLKPSGQIALYIQKKTFRSIDLSNVSILE